MDMRPLPAMMAKIACERCPAVEAAALIGMPLRSFAGIRLDRAAEHRARECVAYDFEIRHSFPIRCGDIMLRGSRVLAVLE